MATGVISVFTFFKPRNLFFVIVWELHIVLYLIFLYLLIVLFSTEDAVGDYPVRFTGLLLCYLVQVVFKANTIIGGLVNTDSGNKLIFASGQHVVGWQYFYFILHHHCTGIRISLIIATAFAGFYDLVV